MKKLTLKNFVKEFAVHLAIFSIFCILYYVMLSYPSFHVEVLYQMKDAIPVFIYGISFCVLFYHLFFKKILFHQPVKLLLRNLFTLVLCFFIADTVWLNLLVDSRGMLNGVIWFEVTSVFRLLMFGAYAVAYSFIRGFSSLRLQKANSEKEKTAASLDNLRTQIEPHFIFNSLNNIYSLALQEGASKTSSSLEELSDLFRYTLKESRAEKVPVSDDLEFIEKYIKLQELRIEKNERILLQSSITWDKEPAKIAPLLIINFIENAFKYGISLHQRSFIQINIDVKDAKLHLMVNNSVHSETPALQNGLGLDNTKKRLELIYPGNYELKEKKRGDLNEIDLTINLA